MDMGPGCDGITDRGTFGRRIKALRWARGVSQQVVADFCEISRGALGHYENGRRVPQVDVARRIAEYYGVGMDKLLEGEH